MNRVLIGFILSLYVLLMSGYTQMYAHAYPSGCDVRPSAKVSETLEQSWAKSQQKSPTAVISPAALDLHKAVFKIDATEVKEEEDEHESVSVRKSVKSISYFTAILFVRLGADFSLSKRGFSFDYQFSYTSTRRYILLRVFRL